MKLKAWLGIGLGLLTILGWGFLKLNQSKVIAVVDGDTIKLADGRTIRYLGIDTPEKDECYFEEAKSVNQNLVLNKQVRVELDKDEFDQYGRTLAYIYVNGELINAKLLELGAGKFYFDQFNLKHQSELVNAVETGYVGKVGLWQKCGQCEIKGNLDKNDKRWYHLKTMRHYFQTEVNLDHGDQWFCSEAEAIKAGFEKARE